MSNTSFSCLQYLCNLSFFKSSDLRKTSLNRSSPSQLLHINPVEMNPHRKLSQQSTRSSRHESKKEPDTAVKTEKEKVSITEKDFRIMQIVRAGKNWKTYMVRKEGDQTLYAMKLIGKKRMAKNSVTDQVTMEKEVLEKAKHCFIPKLAWYFENDKKVFLVSEFIEGPGTLSKVLKQLSRFSEEITRFYSAEILLTIEYLHKELQVAHGDVKLRNFLLDSQGHIKMIDLSQAKKLPTQDMVNASGAREPSGEELVDFWGLGCLIYEFLTGKRPFYDDADDEDKDSELEEMSPISKLVWPCNVSKNAKDLISRLINRTIEERPSLKSIEEIKKHAFFAQVNWEKMANRSVYPPLDPAQFKDKPKEDEDLDDDEVLNLEEIRPKHSKPSSLEKIMEGSSMCNSDEDFDAVSYDRTTCINSVLGYR